MDYISMSWILLIISGIFYALAIVIEGYTLIESLFKNDL